MSNELYLLTPWIKFDGDNYPVEADSGTVFRLLIKRPNHAPNLFEAVYQHSIRYRYENEFYKYGEDFLEWLDQVKYKNGAFVYNGNLQDGIIESDLILAYCKAPVVEEVQNICMALGLEMDEEPGEE